MQPEIQPPAPQPTPVDAAKIKKTNKVKTTWAIICLVGPTALIVLSVVLYAVFNFIAGSQETASIASNTLFSEAGPSPLRTIGNILLFLVGIISILTWLPGIVVGIVLLATRKRV